MLKNEPISEAVRWELAKLLRRIENGIEAQANINRLWQLCEQEKIDFEFLQAFMQHSLLHYDRTLKILAAYLRQPGESMLNPWKIACILCVNDEEQFSEASLYLQHLHLPQGMEMEVIPIRGAASMCAGYEQGRLASNAKYKVYLHQDVLVIRKNLLVELTNGFRNPKVGVIGLAGCEQLPMSGIWWDGMGIHNNIAHVLRPEEIIGYAEEVPCCEVQAADGVLLATQYDIPWRSDILKGWHFYDISLCQEYRRRGYQVILPRQEEPWIIHQTVHDHAGEDYYQQQEIFLQVYQSFC